MWKFVPVNTREGKALADGYLDNIPENGLFPIHEDEFQDLAEAENFDFTFDELQTETPSDNVAYCYGQDYAIMMTEQEFYTEYGDGIDYNNIPA